MQLGMRIMIIMIYDYDDEDDDDYEDDDDDYSSFHWAEPSEKSYSHHHSGLTRFTMMY